MSRKAVSPRSLGALIGLGCSILVLGPALKPGYLLFYDMVFVPHLGLSARTLGTDGSVPRAVPSDLVVALLSGIAPGWVVQKVLLVAVFVGAAAGVASFFRSRVAACAAAVAAAWNPYVGERLAIGHWSFLLGYAALPFLLRAALAYRRGDRWGTTRLLSWTLLIALTGSTGAVIGLMVTVVALLVPGDGARWRQRLRSLLLPLAAFVTANAAWWYPFLFLAPRDAADEAGVQAFMARADTPWGTLPSLLTGGGIWNQGVWFADRATWLVSTAALLAVVIVLGTAFRARTRLPELEMNTLVTAGVIGLLLSGISAVPGGATVMTWVVTNVPGAGLLRDAQKLLAPWMLLLAVASGLAVQTLSDAMRRVGTAGTVRIVLAGAAALWPVATFAGLTWGAGGRWQAVDYPTGFTTMADRIDSLPAGRVAVFPWNLYRRYEWNGNVVTLDPWQRLVDRDVVVNDDLPLAGRVVRGESPDAARVGAAVRAGTDPLPTLRATGVRYVLVQTDQPVTHRWSTEGLDLVASADDLRLYRVPGAVAAPPASNHRIPWLGLVGPPLLLVGIATTGYRDWRKIGVTRE